MTTTATAQDALPKRRFVTRSHATLAFTSLGMGTAPLGNLYRAISNAQALATLEHAWARGVRYYDTAPLYGLGLGETRLGAFLREQPRDDYLLSTKVGRVLQPCAAEARAEIGKFFDVPARQFHYDYTYDGVLRSLEFSYERLGLDRIDIVLCHDLCVFTHGSQEASDHHTRTFLDGGYRALAELRDQGVIRAIGLGVNEWEVCDLVARNTEVDLFLLAGRYTLLEQTPLERFLPLVQQKNMGVIVGGALNSGILATGAVAGAWFNYAPAPPDIMARVAAIETVCRAHGVALREAALQFPLMHPAVVSVVSGAIAPDEIGGNVAAVQRPIPAALWADLIAQGLLRADAPTRVVD